MNENEITELITRRRRQVLAHSFAYYRRQLGERIGRVTAQIPGNKRKGK